MEIQSSKLRVVRSQTNNPMFANFALVNKDAFKDIKCLKLSNGKILGIRPHPVIKEHEIGINKYQRKITECSVFEEVVVKAYPFKDLPQLCNVVLSLVHCNSTAEHLNEQFALKQNFVLQNDDLPIKGGDMLSLNFKRSKYIVEVKSIQVLEKNASGRNIMKDVPIGRICGDTRLEFIQSSYDCDTFDEGPTFISLHSDLTETGKSSGNVKLMIMRNRKTENENDKMNIQNNTKLDMNAEADRLKTFINWPITFISPEECAKSGFYYTKYQDTVRCHFCRVEIGRWEAGDNVESDHKRWSNNCPLLLGKATNNLPFDKSNGDAKLIIVENKKPQYEKHALSNEKELDMNAEADRLKTFINWPVTFISPEECAKSGFYYTKCEDIVRCHFCRVEIGKWEIGDNVKSDHSRLSTTCSLVLGEETNNIPLDISNESVKSIIVQNIKVLSEKNNIISKTNNAALDMNAEADRLKTFINWPVTFISPEECAKSGFYYTEYEDIVRCHFCRVQIGKWEVGDNVESDHMRWSATCPLLLGEETNNIPLGVSLTSRILNMDHESDRLKTFEKWPLHFIEPAELARSGFFYTQNGDEVSCHFCNVKIRHWEKEDFGQIIHQIYSPTCPLVQGRPTKNISSSERKGEINKYNEKKERTGNNFFGMNMEKECDRLHTFAAWSVDFISPRELAQNGFYYTQREDFVCCQFCGVKLGNWEENNVVRVEHERWSPGCLFVRGFPTSNIPLYQYENELSISQTINELGISFGECSKYETLSGISNSDLNLKTLGITKKTDIAHASYSTIEARLQTFHNWPTLATKQRPEKLAEAGFFFTGKSDITLCFSCDGSIRDWMEEDNPWFLHKQWYPECQFLINAARVLLEKRSHQNDLLSKPTHSKNLICKICFNEEICVQFLPCGHLAACDNCASHLSNCCICRKPIVATVQTFLS